MPIGFRGVGRRLVSLAAITFLDCALVQTSYGQDRLVAEQFRSEASPAWERGLAAAGRLQGTIGTTYSAFGPGTEGMPSEETRKTIKQGPGMGLFMSETLKEGGSGDLASVRNPNYGFQVRRKSSVAEWVLAEFDPTGGDGSAVTERQQPMAHLLRTWAGIHFAVHGIPLTELVRDPKFRATAVRATVQGGRELVRVEYECSRPVGARQLIGGQMIVDPARLWCLTESESRIRGSNGIAVSRSVFDCRDSPSGPIPVKLRRTLIRDDKAGVREEFTFDLREADHLGYEEFTLSAFGLPEPTGAPAVRKRVPRYYWLLGASAVFAVGAAVFRWRARRRVRMTGSVPASAN